MKLIPVVVIVHMYDRSNYETLRAASTDGAVCTVDLTKEVRALYAAGYSVESAASTYIQFAEAAIDKLIVSTGTLAYEVEIKQEAVF